MSLVPDLNTIHDLRQLLLKFGTLIYTKDPIADLELMEEECQELYELGMLEQEQYVKAVLLIKQEIRRLQ